MACDGVDPTLEKRAAESTRRAAVTKKMTFAEEQTGTSPFWSRAGAIPSMHGSGAIRSTST